MPDIGRAFGGRKEAERCGHAASPPDRSSGTRRAEKRLQFRKGQFDGIEIRTIRREEAELRAGLFDRRAHRRMFMDGQIVEDDDVTGAQRGHQDLIDIGLKADGPSIGPSNTAVAPRRSRRRPAITVWVSQ